jgi:hypothetical protein
VHPLGIENALIIFLEDKMKIKKKLLVLISIVLIGIICVAILPAPISEGDMLTETWVSHRYLVPVAIRQWDFQNGYVISCWVPPLQEIKVNYTLCSQFIARQAKTLFCEGYILQACP